MVLCNTELRYVSKKPSTQWQIQDLLKGGPKWPRILKPSGSRANLGGGPGGEDTFMSIVRKINNKN